MTAVLSVVDALALVPGWDPTQAVVEELHGGLTNCTYRVAYRGDDFVLRLDRGESAITAVDRSLEVTIQERAHAAGVAPKVMFSAPDHGVLVRQYLPGRVWGHEDITAHKNLEALAAVIRCVHDLPVSGRLFDLQTYARAYACEIDTSQRCNAFVSKCVEIVCNTPIRSDAVCSHNDIVAENIIEHAGLQLIDWEYAADNDPLFDIASAIGYHDLDEQCADVLLSAYLGCSSAKSRERLAAQRRLFDALQWLWLAARNGASPIPRQAERLAALQARIR